MPENEAELRHELLEFLNWLDCRAGVVMYNPDLPLFVPDDLVRMVNQYVIERQPIDPDVIGLDLKGGTSK